MNTLTVHLPKKQISAIIAGSHPGDRIVLTDGERSVTVEPSAVKDGPEVLNLEEDSPELAAELLKAAKGPFTPYSRHDLEAVAEKVRQEKITK